MLLAVILRDNSEIALSGTSPIQAFGRYERAPIVVDYLSEPTEVQAAVFGIGQQQYVLQCKPLNHGIVH